MIFGNLNDVFEGEQSIYEAVQSNTEDYRKPTFVGELLQKLSHYGMSYSEDAYKNMHAIPANTDLLCVYVADDVWGQFDVKESDTLRFSKGDTIDVEVTAFDRTMPMLVCGFADSDTLKTSSDDIGKQLRMFVKPTAESEILRQGMQLVIP